MTTEEPEDGKTKLGRFLGASADKIRAAVTHPNVVRTTQIANAALETLARIGQAKLGGPLGIVTAVLSTIDTVRSNLNIHQEDAFEKFLDDYPEELNQRSSMLGELLMRTKSFQSLKTKTVFESESDNRRIEQMVDDKGKVLFFVINGTSHKAAAYDGEKGGDSSQEYVERTIYVQEDFNYSVLSERIWSTMGSRFVKLIEVDGICSLMPVEEEDVPYLGVHSPQKFAEKVSKIKKHGLSFAALLLGPAGSGKTSFVRSYANHMDGKLFIVPPENLSETGDIQIFADLLRPDIVLFDDFSHSRNGQTEALALMTDLRRKYPEMVLIATANDIENVKPALLRPGRLGEILEFGAPSKEDKFTILIEYMKLYGVDSKLFDIPKLISQMKHKNFTADYVRFCAAQAVVFDQEELLDFIKRAQKFLERFDDENISPSDD